MTGPSLLFDLPYTTVPARLDNADLGIYRPVALVGPEASYAADVTVLDVADYRLIRSGVELAHRVIDGRGDWFLRAPQWQPALPTERVEPFAEGDLPEQLGDLVMPFRRHGSLGPVAAIRHERQGFELRGEGTDPVAWLRDDRVTIRRGGVATSRYRELRIDPGPADLSAEQRHWLIHAVRRAGGTPVDEFPSLATRLGTPATGPTDYPCPQPIRADAGFAQFIESVIAGRLRELIVADLAGRAGEADAAAGMLALICVLHSELNGLASALEPEWLAELVEELDWFSRALTDVAEAGGDRVALLRSTLRRERYLRLLDLLVVAARGPQIDVNTVELPAAETLAGLLDDAVGKLIEIAGGLAADAPGEDWAAAAVAAEEVGRVDRLAQRLVGKKRRRAARKLRPAGKLLHVVQVERDRADHAEHQAKLVSTKPSADVSAVFELGRSYQRHLQRETAARQEFLQQWTRTLRKVRR